jgi:hypothetical protein
LTWWGIGLCSFALVVLTCYIVTIRFTNILIEMINTQRGLVVPGPSNDKIKHVQDAGRRFRVLRLQLYIIAPPEVVLISLNGFGIGFQWFWFFIHHFLYLNLVCVFLYLYKPVIFARALPAHTGESKTDAKITQPKKPTEEYLPIEGSQSLNAHPGANEL